MRMEAKNSYFKRVAQIGNFKNIALTVARRHQKLVCAYLNDKNFFGKLIFKSSRKLVFILWVALIYLVIPSIDEAENALSSEDTCVQEGVLTHIPMFNVHEQLVSRY